MFHAQSSRVQMWHSAAFAIHSAPWSQAKRRIPSINGTESSGPPGRACKTCQLPLPRPENQCMDGTEATEASTARTVKRAARRAIFC
eukprot:2645908-Amphidinium_carterae.1